MDFQVRRLLLWCRKQVIVVFTWFCHLIDLSSTKGMLAVEEDADILKCEHVEAAFVSIKPQITQDMIEFYQTFSSKY
jgi:hypothetical protein